MSQIAKDVSTTIGPIPNWPSKVFEYYAYKHGECKIFKSRDDAEKYSKLIEKVQSNIEEYNQQVVDYKSYQGRYDNLYIEKCCEYFGISKDQYMIYYQCAKNLSYSGNEDSIFSTLEELTQLVNKLSAVQ